MIEPAIRPTCVPSSTDLSLRRKRGGRQVPKRLWPRGNRHAFRPLAMERLEARQLLSSDLTAEIGSLISSQANGTHDLGSVSLGSFLTSPDVSVTLIGVSQQADSGWSGSVTVTAASATLGIGSVTGSIAGATPGANGLTGTYTLNDQPLADGSYALAVGELSVTIPGALQASATGVNLDYNPSSSAGQTILAVNSATATLIPLNNATLSLSNLAIMDDGFTLGNATVTGGPIALGGVVSVTAPSVSFSNVAYTTGSALTGTITVQAASASLFPGNSNLTATMTNFEGTYNLGTSALSLQAGSAEVAVGRIFDAKASDIGLTWDGTTATVDLDSASLTSPLFPGASATLSDLHASNFGFTIAQADLLAPEIKLGGVLDIQGLDLGVTGLSYVTATNAVSGTFTIGTSAVSILPGSTAFTTSVSGFSASYNITSDALTVSASAATVTVGSSLIVTANGLSFSLAPAPGGMGDNVTVSVASGSISLPQEGVSGAVTGLTITNDGFDVGSATLSATNPAMPFSAFGGKFTITDPSVSLTDFGYSISAGAQFNSELTLSASAVDFNPTPAVSIAATGITGTISFTTTSVGHFTFSAATVNSMITLSSGPSLSLSGTNISFDSAPLSGGYMAQFGSLTAEVKAGALDVTGSAQDFAIDPNGQFVTLPGFGVSLDLSNSSSIQWPSWLPIQITTLAATWPNFDTDPADFTLDLSASIDAKLGSTLSVSGTITDATIDVGLLEQGKFPITGLAGAGISVSGTLFGASVTGAAFFDILDVDSNGKPTTVAADTANRIFYGGIEGGISFAGAAGFKVRLGVSSLGPLDAFVEVDAPILLDPDSGLAVTNLYGAIDFDESLPSITTAQALATNPAFTPPTEQSLTDWENQLAGQVATQASLAAAGMNVLDAPITISAGATLFDEYASQYAFQLAGNLVFDTTGKFEASGTLTLGNELSIKGAVYADLSHAAQGDATILLYAEVPVQAPIATFYGSVVVTTGGDLDLNGTNQYAETQGRDLSLDNSSFTVEFWAKRNDTGRAETVISQGTTNGFQAGFDASNDFVVTFGGKTLTYANTDENWHHWAVTFDDTTGTRTLYEDGEEVATDTTSAISGGGNSLYIGNSGTTYFDGSVDAVRVWNNAQAATDIQDNYLSGSVTPTANLIGAWNFDTGAPSSASPTAPDLSGKGNTLTFYNSPSFATPAGATPAPFARDGGFEIDVTGEVDLTIPSLPGGLVITGNATFQIDPANTSLDMTVSGSADLNPLGQLAALAGSVHFDDAGGSPHLYGAFIIESDLSKIPIFESAGLTANGIGVLRFNTTSTTQNAILTLPGASSSTSYPLPADAFSLYIDGAIGINNVFELSGTLYASFSYATLPNGSTNPELDIAFSDNLQIGPSSAPVLSLSSSGVLEISSAGLAAQLTVSPQSSTTLSNEGINLSGTSFTLIVNTTGVNQSFTVPTILDPNGNVSPGSGATYTVPGAPAVPGQPAVANPPATGSPYLLVYGTANMSIGGDFDLQGSFDMLVTQSEFRIDVNQMALSIEDNNKTILSFTAQGGLLLETSGFAGAIAVSLAPTSPQMNDVQIAASFTFEVNTTSVQQTVGGILIPGPSVMLSGTGNLDVGPAGGQFDISGSLTITVNQTGLSLAVSGMAELGVLGNLAIAGDLEITNDGLYGAMDLSATVEPFSDFLLTGQFQIEFNTTTTLQTADGISIPNGTFELHVSGAGSNPNAQLEIANVFDVSGYFNLTVSPAGFTLGASGSLAFMGQQLATGTVVASIYNDGHAELALYAGLTLKAGASLAGLNFSIQASPDLEVNTGSIAFATGLSGAAGPATIPANTVQVALKNAEVQAFGFTATGSIIATASNGGFDITIPQSSPLSLSFLSLGTVQAYGYFDSDGDFSLSATVGYDDAIGPFELYGSIGATISNTGFSAYFSGGANLNTAFGTVNLASAAASIVIESGYFHLQAAVSVLGLPAFHFDASLGADPQPQGQPGLQYYSVPPLAGAGEAVQLNALDNESTGSSIPGNDYQWVVSTGGSTFASGTGGSYGLTLGAPGTYTVSLYDTVSFLGVTNSVLLKQSNITVVEIPPTIPTLGLNAAYPVGQPFVFGGAVDAVNYNTLQYNWSVLRDGAAFASGNTNNIAFTPMPSPAAKQDNQVDSYTFTLTVSDSYGGSATATGTFTALNPENVIVTSALDDVVPGSSTNTDPGVTLREAFDLILDNASSGTVPTIQFAPSLAGKTIVLSQTEYLGDPGPGGSDLGLDSPLIIDASAAPGLTIEGALTFDHRLFDVGPQGALTLRNVNLEGGEAVGSGAAASGGAIYDQGYVFMQDCAVIGNSAVSTGTASSGNSALGGAVYVATGASFTALDSTFANNTAVGASASAGTAQGAAIYDNGFSYLVNDTIANNSVTAGTGGTAYGSGLYAASANNVAADLEIYNTIIANNSGAGQNLYAQPAQYLIFLGMKIQSEPAVVFVNGDGNLITSNSGAPASLIATASNPSLGLFTQRTDGIWSYDLLPGSPALNAGDATWLAGIYDPGQVALDTQGLPRFNNGLVDIGAFEHQPSLLVTNAKGSGPGSIADAVDGDDDGTPIIFASTLAGEKITLSVGALNVQSNITITGPGANNLTISGGGLSEIFTVAPSAHATITGLTLANGLAVQGGAILNAGNLTLTQDALINNHAQGNISIISAAGGAIYNSANASLTLNDDTVSNNSAVGWNNPYQGFDTGGTGRGGAIYNAAGATINGTDDTFAYNLAQGGSGFNAAVGSGGAIDDYGKSTLTGFTLAFNSVVQGATGVQGNGSDIMVESGGVLVLTNSIAADATGGLDIDNLGNYSGNNNLVMASSGVPAKTIISTADPMLRPLANYGGPTPTLPLGPGSPAIGQGSLSSLPATDQRGDARTYLGTVDLGADELQHYVVTSTKDSGTGSLRWAVASDFDETPITFSLSRGAQINLTSGPIVITQSLNIVGPGASQVTINAAKGAGVFTVSSGTDSITGLTIANGQAVEGGGVFNSGALTLSGDVFQNDIAQGGQTGGLSGVGSGGAIYNAIGGTLTVTASTFQNDRAQGAAGVSQIVSDGRNQGDGGGARGGAIANAAGAVLTVIDDTFTQDIAQGGNGVTWTLSGGATYVGNGGVAYGGAIDNAGSATITNATFDANQIKQGGQSTINLSDGTDIVNELGGTLTLYNTIAAKPGTANDIVNHGMTTGGGNVVMASTGLATGVVALASDPLLIGLSNNGPTPTMSLQTQSPAFGLGVVAVAPALDQLGNPRTVGGFVDPGAVELQVAPPQPSAGTGYTINAGQPLALNASQTVNPANSNLTYSWDIAGQGTFTAASGMTPTLSWAQLQALGIGVGTTTVEVRVNDGYGGVNHTVVSQPVSLTVLPAFQVATVTPASPGATQSPLSVVDNAIELSFGAASLGGKPTSTAGNRYDEIDVDGIAEAFYFDRILGDVNGDGQVNVSDVNLMTEYFGSSVPGQVINVDGSGRISSMDQIITVRSKGNSVAPGVHLDA